MRWKENTYEPWMLSGPPRTSEHTPYSVRKSWAKSHPDAPQDLRVEDAKRRSRKIGISKSGRPNTQRPKEETLLIKGRLRGRGTIRSLVQFLRWVSPSTTTPAESTHITKFKCVQSVELVSPNGSQKGFKKDGTEIRLLS